MYLVCDGPISGLLLIITHEFYPILVYFPLFFVVFALFTCDSPIHCTYMLAHVAHVRVRWPYFPGISMYHSRVAGYFPVFWASFC